jgi:ABC-type sugar transport system ATPase subunit
VKAEVKASEVKAAETVTIDATELATMKASIAALEIKANEGVKASEALKAKEVSEFVETHVKRGAIKAGEAEATTKMILASEDADGMKTLITNLPDRIIAAGEQGESDKGSLGNAQTAIEAKTKEILASEDGKSLDYATALKMTLNSNPELAREYAADLQGRA